MLDANDVRFQAGTVTTKNMSDAYLEIVKLLVKYNGFRVQFRVPGSTFGSRFRVRF